MDLFGFDIEFYEKKIPGDDRKNRKLFPALAFLSVEEIKSNDDRQWRNEKETREKMRAGSDILNNASTGEEREGNDHAM